MAFLSLQLQALRAEAVSWQRRAPRPEEADLQPLDVWREVGMSPEQAQGEQVRVSSVILKTFPLFLRKETPEVGGGEAGLPGDPRYGGICSRGPALGACCGPSPGPKVGRAACLSRGAQRPARLAPLHQQEFLPCRDCRERRVFN